MRRLVRPLLLTLLACGLQSTATAQLAPSLGYMVPPGGQAGATVEVTLGGYDWTPDMQVFVHDPRITLEIVGPPGEILVPDPPYWFGKKARRAPDPLPRETRARLTIPADVPAGPVKWQAANANGATATGTFLISRHAQLIEAEARQSPLSSSRFPLSVAGQIVLIQEVDRYEFLAERDGLVTCAIDARKIGSPLNAALEIRAADGRLIAETADTGGYDTEVTFAVKAGTTYSVDVYDLDFRGDRSYVYRLTFQSGPRVRGVIPAAAKPGTTSTFELRGIGVATGAPQFETTTKELTFAHESHRGRVTAPVAWPDGTATTVELPVSGLEEIRGVAGLPGFKGPLAFTGLFDQPFGSHRYTLSGSQGEVWSLNLQAATIGCPLDVALAILDADGKELARNDDLPGTTDAGLEFTLPAEGDYTLVVIDVSGQSGRPDALYRLAVEPAAPRFELETPELVNLPIGGKVNLSLKVKRIGGLKDPIALTLTGLPEGVSLPESLVIPEGAAAFNVELNAAGDAAAIATPIVVQGEARRAASETQPELVVTYATGPVLLATTLKPPFEIDAEGKDDVTKWPRGSTFPAPVLIERQAGFDGEIVLEMTSRQGRHRQGIRGPDLVVPPGVSRLLYPVRLPEWLETTRTSRMVVNGVAKVPDPKGNIRYCVTRQKTRMGFLPTGALLKLAAEIPVIETRAGAPIELSLSINRSPQLTESIQLEWIDPAGVLERNVVLPEDPAEVLTATAHVSASIAPGEYTVTLRATVLRDGIYPVISEADVLIVVQ